MYFDTLKVSTVEQTTEQTSARGGLGNAEHVIWDYGKEIKLTLQDALYTPASQSLLWGGLYGLKPIKVKGVWVPAIYETDDYGNTIYYKKQVLTAVDYKNDKDAGNGNNLTKGKKDWVGFYCLCDYEMKYMTYVPEIVDPFSYNDTKLTRGKANILINGKEVSIGDTVQNYKGGQKKDGKGNVIATYGAAEKADLLINNFETFENHQFVIKKEEGNYTVTESQNNYADCHSMLEYYWSSCMGQMTTTSINKKQAYSDDIDFCIHSFEDNNNKRFLFKEGKNYICYKHFYKTITKKLKGFDIIEEKKSEDGTTIFVKVPVEKFQTFQVYLGTFFIIEDWNISNTLEEPGIHLLDSKIKTTSLLERMEDKQARQAFCIDVDKNIKAYNAMKDPKYSQSNLTVYIDPNTLVPYEANAHEYDTQSGDTIHGNLRTFKQGEYYLQYTRERATPENQFQQITVQAQDYPGTFKLVGETYVRNRFGEDSRYQFEIPLCKLISNVTFDLQADGDPTTVDMELKVLRQEDGTMMRLTHYNVEEKCDCPHPVTIPVFPGEPPVVEDNYTYNILSPKANEIFCVGRDCRIPDESYAKAKTEQTFLMLPSDDADARRVAALISSTEDKNNGREYLLIEILNNDVHEGYVTKENSSDVSMIITYLEGDN